MSTSIKRITGNEYLYYSYYENSKKIDVYCGPVGSPKSERKYLESSLNI